MDDCQPPSRRKILIIRFSAIGDIVLTTPVIRAIKAQILHVEIHFLVKREYASLLEYNPHISKIHAYSGNLKATQQALREEHFDFIVDLQKNYRSKRIVSALHVPAGTFSKHNILKWIFVNFKINFLPNIHIVDRYFEAVKKLNVVHDGGGLDFYIPENKEFDEEDLPAVFENGFVAVALGSLHGTKRIPVHKIVDIARILYKPVMLLGGKDVISMGDDIVSQLGDKAYNGCGKFTIFQSASILKQADCLLTGDTGMMHIAAALQIPIASLWGNTVPEFGMYPYMPQQEDKFRIFEVCTLPCRPCSKLGYEKCPKKHFNCMNHISTLEVAEWINKF